MDASLVFARWRQCASHLYMLPWAHPNGISIGSAVFAGLTTVTDQQTDRPRYSVVVLRCGLIIATVATCEVMTMWWHVNVALQRAEVRMIRWPCGVRTFRHKIRDYM